MKLHGQITKKKSRFMRLGATCLLLLFSSACAHIYTIDDKPLSEWTPEYGSAAVEQVAGDRSSELLVLVAFSGGGTRAAAFAYGVLQELAETEIITEEDSRPLLKEIDMISSVSGGSFTSAYYGLHGDRIFEDFEDRFLRQNVEGHLLWMLANPVNWFRLASSVYGKADMAAGYYDKILFDNATFADMNRPDAPVVIINSTDLTTGMRIPFTMPYFDALCLDLQQYSVARAVTASSSVPGLFSPITLKNHAGSCGFVKPAWLLEAAEDGGTTYRKLEAKYLLKYLDPAERPWLQLVDGGVSDNLGLRSFYTLFVLTGDMQNTLKSIHHADVRKILIISVDSHTKSQKEWTRKRNHPSLAQVLGSVTGTQISRYSIDTMLIVQNAFEKWTEGLSAAGHPTTFHFVEVSFDEVENEADRSRLYEIGTNFNLSDEEVDLLISSARQVVRKSSALKKFLAENTQ